MGILRKISKIFQNVLLMRMCEFIKNVLTVPPQRARTNFSFFIDFPSVGDEIQFQNIRFMSNIL